MKNKLQKIKEESLELCAEISSDLQTIHHNTEQIADEYHRVTEISRAPMVVINEIDRQFEKATKLHGIDVAFLFVATALQCIRQYVLTAIPQERPNDQDAANQVYNGEKKKAIERIHRYYNPTLEEILLNPVPFDAQSGSGQFGALAGFGHKDHRFATPGHDPLLGLLFGTANIATSTLTNWRMESFHIKTGSIGRGAIQDILSEQAKTPLVMHYTADKLLHQGSDGRAIIAASLQKEVIHLRSDIRSKDSLPLPCVSVVNPTLGGELAKRGLDMATVLDVGKQFIWALFIDTLVALIHSFFFDPTENISRRMYEIRTRKILLYSNLLATSSNVIVAAVGQYLGADGTKIADWGGYVNTLRHIAADIRFIQEVKKDFLKNNLCDRITGAEYDFMKGDF